MQGKVVGVLSVYADMVGAFDAGDIVMLDELAMDLGHALQSFDDRATREKSEIALAKSEERFRTVVESSPVAIFIVAGDCFVYINEAGLRLFGALHTEELLGQSVLDRFHPDFRESTRKRIQRLHENPHPVSMVEEACIKLDGTSVGVDISVVPFTYQKQAGSLVFAMDISKRRHVDAKQPT